MTLEIKVGDCDWRLLGLGTEIRDWDWGVGIRMLKLEISLRFDKKYFGIIQGFQR